METALWIVFLIICVIAEAATSLSLVTIWFIPGTIIAAILSVFNVPLWIQIVVFLVISILSLAMTINMRHTKKQLEKTNKDSLIGRTAILQEDCSAYKPSSIKFGDVVWTAKTLDGEVLDKNTLVEIVRIEGNTLIIKKGV